MAYNITLSNGQNLVTVADGTTDTTYTSLVLIGKNFAGYGEFLNENFVHLLENFSSSTSPANPLQGQIWWDSTNKILKVYSGSGWKTVSSSTSSAAAPANGIVGDLWWDTANGQLKIWSGSTWTVIGPAYTSTQGQSGPVADVVTGASDGLSHVIVKFFISNTLVSILSKDAAFQVNGLPGFTVIKPGFNLAAITPSLAYYGDSENALSLGGYPASDYVRSAAAPIFTQQVKIASNAGLTVGTTDNFSINVGSTSINLLSNDLGKDLRFFVNVNGVATQALSMSGATGLLTIVGDPTAALGIATKQYVDGQLTGVGSVALARDGSNSISGNIVPATNNTFNFGSASTRFNTMYATTFNGTAVTAQYADLAERFEADATYIPGTVVELGGTKEITAVVDAMSDNVFGVISTNAAYLMNAGAGNNETHPPIAVQGRVPVRVIGTVRKGDRLISAGNGLARAATKSEVTPFNVIGRALEAKETMTEGTVEAVVKLNT
jgi:hypothetical protein